MKWRGFSKHELTNSQTSRTLFSLWCIHGMPSVDCTHQTSMPALITFMHLSHCGSEACNPMYKKFGQVSVARRWQFASSWHVLQIPCQPGNTYRVQRWKSLAARLWLLVTVSHNIQATTPKSVTTPAVRMGPDIIMQSNNTLVHQPSSFVMHAYCNSSTSLYMVT